MQIRHAWVVLAGGAAVLSAVAGAPSPTPRVFSDPQAEALARRVIEALGAESVVCPKKVVHSSTVEVFFCARLPKAPGDAKADIRAAVDDVLRLGASSPKGKPWKARGHADQRSFMFKRQPFDVRIDTRSGMVVIRHPAQCLDPGLLAAVDEGDEIRPPVPRSKAYPVYPEFARAAHSTARVVLQIFVSREGNVSEACVLDVNAPTRYGFEQAAVDAVRQWRFSPATTQGGEPVEIPWTVVVEFTLR